MKPRPGPTKSHNLFPDDNFTLCLNRPIRNAKNGHVTDLIGKILVYKKIFK